MKNPCAMCIYYHAENNTCQSKKCVRLLNLKKEIDAVYDKIRNLPSAQPEQRVEELLPDGTLHLFTDTDLSKVNRVWVSQNNTHYGDLYYADEDPKRGKWIPCSERLPNTNGIYNVTRSVSDGFYSFNITDTCYFDGSDTWYDDTRINHERKYLTDVLAWMPLPEPYTERRKE